MPDKRRPGRPPTLDRPRRLHVELDERTWNSLSIASEKLNVSMSILVRAALEAYLPNLEQ